MEMGVFGIFLVDIFTLRQRWMKEKAQLEEQPTALNDGMRPEEKWSGMMTLRNLDGTGCLIGSHRFRNEHKPQLEIDEALLRFCNVGFSSIEWIYWETNALVCQVIEEMNGSLAILILTLSGWVV